jgi:hypothetical protein
MKRAYLRECRLNLHTGKWEATQSVWIIDRASFEGGGSTIPTVRELLRDGWAEAGKCTALMAPEHRPLHILVIIANDLLYRLRRKLKPARARRE